MTLRAISLQGSPHDSMQVNTTGAVHNSRMELPDEYIVPLGQINSKLASVSVPRPGPPLVVARRGVAYPPGVGTPLSRPQMVGTPMPRPNPSVSNKGLVIVQANNFC